MLQSEKYLRKSGIPSRKICCYSVPYHPVNEFGGSLDDIETKHDNRNKVAQSFC